MLQPRRIVRDDGHSVAESNAEPIESGRHLSSSLGDLAKGQRRPGIGWLIWLIDDGNAVWIVELGPIDESLDREWRAHWFPLYKRALSQ